MRTFRILVAGWLAGGAMIVLLAMAASDPAVVAAPGRLEAGGPAGRMPALRSVQMAIPVLGVDALDLHDTFDQARSGGRTHRALDILAPRGTPVIAAVDGTIRKLDTSAAGGLSIYQFDVDEERVYYYAHLDRYADRIAEGQFVPQGTVVGYVGSTGNAPEGTPHLHFSVEVLPPSKQWWKGQPLNPYPMLTARASAPR